MTAVDEAGSLTAERSGPARPLPIGAFPLPFGFLLLPPDSGDGSVAQVRDGLLAGRLPAGWPAALRGHELALAGDLEGALAAFDGDDPVSAYNRLVIHPDAEDPAAVAAELVDGAGEPLGVLVDLVLFALGRSDTPPAADGLDGELAALALAGRATATALHDPAAAVPLLQQAIAAAAPVYPALAGVLHGAAAQLTKAEAQQLELPAGQVAPQVIGALQAGIGLLDGTDLRVGLAEQHLELGSTFHELAGDDRPDLLGAAVQQYHDALQAIGKDEAPELYAATHANLAAAYLTMPMQQASDQLRLGVALASLREALTVYTPQTHPQRWASVQLNLANALVYAPSTHQGDNLVEAVELYEAVLAARDRDADPLGYARVLANQGNALAHLGMFEHARGKLVEARFIFEEFRQYEAVTSVRGVLDEIARRTTMASTADVEAGPAGGEG